MVHVELLEAAPDSESGCWDFDNYHGHDDGAHDYDRAREHDSVFVVPYARKYITSFAVQRACVGRSAFYGLATAHLQLRLLLFIDLWQSDHKDAVFFAGLGHIYIHFFGEHDGARK